MIVDDKEKQAEEKRFLNKRVIICLIIILVIFCGFACKLFMWQIVEGESYSKLADTSTAYTVTTDATRGEILDCNGKGLAVNRTGYRIVLDKLYIDAANLDNTILSLMRLMNSRNEKWIDNLPIKIDEQGVYRFKKGRSDEIKVLKSKDYLDLKPSDNAEKCNSSRRLRCEILCQSIIIWREPGTQTPTPISSPRASAPICSRLSAKICRA